MMGAILLCFINCDGQSHKMCPQTATFEEGGDLKWNQTEVPVLTSLIPNCYAKLAHVQNTVAHHRLYIYMIVDT